MLLRECVCEGGGTHSQAVGKVQRTEGQDHSLIRIKMLWISFAKTRIETAGSWMLFYLLEFACLSCGWRRILERCWVHASSIHSQPLILSRFHTRPIWSDGCNLASSPDHSMINICLRSTHAKCVQSISCESITLLHEYIGKARGDMPSVHEALVRVGWKPNKKWWPWSNGIDPALY